ncbi:hypothetical protein GCM10010991_35290 [Gemmobacter aquaticus]|uniref:Uncharacterized protein n=1 Tax=Gemmobacter aquaticus TaxID=490185 RepID=A0A917YMX4_9RHOB|nr:hypothetical protein GCM10010991_35290 [Gemmobacter aquaticus]
MGAIFLGVARPIAALRLPVFFRIPEILCVGALVFPTAVATPALQAIRAAATKAELACVAREAAL